MVDCLHLLSAAWALGGFCFLESVKVFSERRMSHSELVSLKLSGSLPLHIQAALPDERKKSAKRKRHWDMPGLVLGMLNYYSERWSTLVIYLPPRLLSHLRGVSSGAPALECLRLNYLEDQKTPYKFQLSSGLPSPRVVEVRGDLSFSFNIEGAVLLKLWKNYSSGRCARYALLPLPKPSSLKA